MAEFVAHYGGTAEWEIAFSAASAQTEQAPSNRRIDPGDGKAYTMAEFIAHYGGTDEWEQAQAEARGQTVHRQNLAQDSFVEELVLRDSSAARKIQSTFRRRRLRRFALVAAAKRDANRVRNAKDVRARFRARVRLLIHAGRVNTARDGLDLFAATTIQRFWKRWKKRVLLVEGSFSMAEARARDAMGVLDSSSDDDDTFEARLDAQHPLPDDDALAADVITRADVRCSNRKDV